MSGSSADSHGSDGHKASGFASNLQSWRGIAIAFLIAVAFAVLMWIIFHKNFDHSDNQTIDYGTEQVAAVQPQYLDLRGISGPLPTMSVGPGQLILPEHYYFDVDVLAGTLAVQGRDGTILYIQAGGAITPPAGFQADRIWSDTGAVINASFTPDPNA